MAIWNPLKILRLAAQTKTAQAERDTARKFAADMNGQNLRLHKDLRVVRAELAEANAKIARTVGNLKRGPSKPNAEVA